MAFAIWVRDENDLELARCAHERSLQLAHRPGDRLPCVIAFAATLRRLKRPSDALARLQEALELDHSRETNKAGYTCLVGVLRDLRRPEAAWDEGRLLVEIHPDDGLIWNALGGATSDVAWRTGEIDLLHEAESCFRRARELGVPGKNARADLLALAAAYRKFGLESDAARLEQLLGIPSG
jgi:hypothetical protein